MLGVGLIALAFEVFVVPGFGIAGLIAIMCIGAATFLALLGSLPTWGDVARASGILSLEAGIVVTVIYVFVRHLPSGNRFWGVFLKAATSR